MSAIRVTIIGGSGYTGGELLRLLLFHPDVRLQQITSRSLAGKAVSLAHPNLRNCTDLRFSSEEALETCDVLFLCLPHGEVAHRINTYLETAPRIIDLSSDFRLSDAGTYQAWYSWNHPRPDLLGQFIYGLPEINRSRLNHASLVSCPGCNATAAILGLYPLFAERLVEPDQTVVEVKAGSSQGGSRPGPGAHHPERSGCVRTYKPVGHRHTAELEQVLSTGEPVRINLTATAVERVRGVQAASHVFLKEKLTTRTLWSLYRKYYSKSPFIRLLNAATGNCRVPDPGILSGTNFCDIGFTPDPRNNRVVVISALDNLMKGAAGQAVQCFNLMHGLQESTGLRFPGLHPV